MGKKRLNSRDRGGIRHKCTDIKTRIAEIEIKKYSLASELADIQRKCLHPKTYVIELSGQKRKHCPDCDRVEFV